MPTKSTYKPYSLSSKAVKKYNLSVTQFLGVDYNPSQIAVSKVHAVDMQNLIYKDKVVQKRTGYEQLACIEAETYTENGEEKTNTTNINGIWSFVAEDGNKYVVAHVGRLLYNIEGMGNDKTFLDFKWTKISGLLLLADRKSSAFVGTKRLYILDGEKYRVLRHTASAFTLVNVEDDTDTYIPTTTIGITYIDSGVGGAAALDDVNLMTQWKKNKLVSDTGKNVSDPETTYYDWELDSSIKCKNEADMLNISVVVEVKREGNE